MDDLKALLRKYATFEKDGKRYWRVEIKMSFSLQSSVQAFKAEGDRQAKDPFRGISIIYRPSKWIDKDGRHN